MADQHAATADWGRPKPKNNGSFLTEEEQRAVDSGSCPSHYQARIRRQKFYDLEVCQQIQVIYIIAIIVWIILVWALEMYKTDVIGWFFILLPVVVFTINYNCVHTATRETEGDMFAGNFLSFTFLIAAILISWTKLGTQAKFFKLLFTALILIMFSLIDVWLPKNKMIIQKHLRTIFQTGALGLLALALYMYYTDVIKNNPGYRDLNLVPPGQEVKIGVF